MMREKDEISLGDVAAIAGGMLRSMWKESVCGYQ